MGKTKSLLKNTIIVSVGKLATQFITFFLLPIYTAYLSKEEYGVVDLLNTLVNLLLPIVTLQIEQGMFRFLIDNREKEDKKQKIISTVIIFTFVQLILYWIVFFICNNFIANDYKYFLIANLSISILVSILLQVARGLGKNLEYAIGSFIVGVLYVILNLVLIVGFKLGAYGMLSANFVANLVCFIYLIVKENIFRYLKPRFFDKEILKYLIKYSIPLIPNTLSWWIVNFSDRGIITAFLGIGQNGIYSVANKFSNVFSSLYSAFNLTWTESASINIESEDRDEFFSKIYNVTINFFGALAIEIIVLLQFAFRFLINEEYNEAYNQVPILMVASFFSVLVSFIGSIYIAKKNTKEIAKTSILSAVINVLVNLLLIKKIGLFAGSISTLAAYFIMFVYRYNDSKRYVKLSSNRKTNLLLVIFGIFAIWGYYSKLLILKVSITVIFSIFAIIINKTSFEFIVQSVLSKIKNKR